MSVTAAVMYQFVTPKAACAPLMMIVSSSSGCLLCGSKASGAPVSISLYAEMPLPIAGITDQAVHEHTRHADQRRRHQRDAPLQR